MKLMLLRLLLVGGVMFTVCLAIAGGHDELLVVLPHDDVEQAQRVAVASVHLYHRLGDHYLAGMGRGDVLRLHRRGIEAVIVDDRPWTGVYAVVGTTPRSSALPSLSALYQAEGFQLIRTSDAELEALRKDGYSCVKIEKDEIPFDPVRQFWLDPINPSPRIDSTVALVSDTSVRNYIQALQNFGTRYWSNANRDSVARYLEAQFRRSGLTDVQIDNFTYSGTTQANLVATMTGGTFPQRELIVGGHHDSYSSNVSNAPGADDNASGTAASLEMARVLKLVNYSPHNTIRFMTYGAEEAGLRGSASYAQRARTANRDIRAMLNYDMIANRTQSSPDRDVNVVWYTGAEALSNLHVAAARAYTTITPILSTSSRSGSDSYSFWQQGYKAVFLIERDFSPYYHTPNDLIQYLDMPYCRDIIRSGLATLMTLDQMPPAVAGLSLRDRGDGQRLRVTWDSVTVLDWAAYRVYVGRVPGIYDTSYTTTSRSYMLSGLTSGQQYFVGVAIQDIAGMEGFISERSLTPLAVPRPPAGLALDSRPADIRLRWRPNQELDIAGYNIYRQSGTSETFVKLNASLVRDTTYVDAPTMTIRQRYIVSAVDSASNEGAPSDTVVYLPPASAGNGTGETPFSFRLQQNYPNPFNPSTQMTFEIDERAMVEIAAFDVLGRKVETLLSDVKDPGIYALVWSPNRLASGTYIVQMKSGAKFSAIRTILMK